MLTTTMQLEGYRITDYLGLAKGFSTKNLGLAGAFKLSTSRIELENFSALLEETQQHAEDELRRNACELGADAVVGIRFELGKANEGISSVFIYGTAVKTDANDSEVPQD